MSNIAGGFGLAQGVHMAAVQQIEATVGENHRLTVGARRRRDRRQFSQAL